MEQEFGEYFTGEGGGAEGEWMRAELMRVFLYSGRPRGHDRGDLQQDEEVDLGPTGSNHLGAVEGATMTWPGQYYVDVATDESQACVEEQAAAAAELRGQFGSGRLNDDDDLQSQE